jgi:glutamate synthase (ferredoxin)
MPPKALAQRILANWDESLPKFVCVMHNDYERMMQIFKEIESSGLSGEEAIMAAFELNRNDVSRVSGN